MLHSDAKGLLFFSGSCTFEMVPGYYGDTGFDFTPSNDEVHPYKSDEQCAELCLNSWSIYPHPDLRVVEECWGFTTSATECRLHNVLKPSYFDIPSNKISSSSTNLFIKRCFASKKNYSSKVKNYGRRSTSFLSSGWCSMLATSKY